jgi:CheY-like chemotaxis protein
VADDDAQVRVLLQIYLDRVGFAVWMTGGGAEALEVYRRHQQDIAIVLLDIHMPGMTGPQTLQALQALNPDVRCCFMTGDSGNYAAETSSAQAAVPVLHKPFLHLEEVTQRLRDTMSQPR